VSISHSKPESLSTVKAVSSLELLEILQKRMSLSPHLQGAGVRDNQVFGHRMTHNLNAVQRAPQLVRELCCSLEACCTRQLSFIKEIPTLFSLVPCNEVSGFAPQQRFYIPTTGTRLPIKQLFQKRGPQRKKLTDCSMKFGVRKCGHFGGVLNVPPSPAVFHLSLSEYSSVKHL
jgi:hypothetical protein